MIYSGLVRSVQVKHVPASTEGPVNRSAFPMAKWMGWRSTCPNVPIERPHDYKDSYDSTDSERDDATTLSEPPSEYSVPDDSDEGNDRTNVMEGR